MVRLVDGVRRYRAAGFVADAWSQGDRLLLSIRPTAGDLKAFVASGLSEALAEAVQVLTAQTLVAQPPGELVLPVVQLALPGGAVQRLSLAYDETYADLRGLDGGGTYISTASDAPTMLALGVDGLTLRAAYAMAFTYSPLNIYGPSYGVVTTMVNPGTLWFDGETLPACPSAEPDLRSFVLALLDENRRVVALSGIADLAGPRCQ